MTRPTITFCDKGECTCTPRLSWRHYTVNGERVPSVSTIIGTVVDKAGALQWYAARVTREGIIRMLKEGKRIPRDEKALHYRMRDLGLTYQQATSDAAERGTAIHRVLEDWIDHGTIPTLADHPEEWHGWIRGLARFLRECEPEFRESEIMVGSAKHGFAGRRDTVAYCVGGKGKLSRSGSTLLDLKTAGAVYPESMFAQLAGYDLGGIECGEAPTDHQAIVRVGVDGKYEVAYSVATHDDFLAYLTAFNAQRGITQRFKEATENR